MSPRFGRNMIRKDRQGWSLSQRGKESTGMILNEDQRGYGNKARRQQESEERRCKR